MPKTLFTRRATSADIPRVVDLMVSAARVGALIEAQGTADDLILVERPCGVSEEYGALVAVIVVRPGPVYDVFHLGISKTLAMDVRAEAKRRAGLALAAKCVLQFIPDNGLGGSFTEKGSGRRL